MMTRITVLVLLMSFSVLWAGCSQQEQNKASSEASQGLQTANKDVDQLAAQARPALDKLNLGGRVTAALQANPNLPSSIRVDASIKGVRLRGHVANAHQKRLAGIVAKETVPPGDSVDNELAVQGG